MIHKPPSPIVENTHALHQSIELGPRGAGCSLGPDTFPLWSCKLLAAVVKCPRRVAGQPGWYSCPKGTSFGRATSGLDWEVTIVKLPNAERAFIPQRKVTDHLLSTTHPAGRSKAAFFARFGFTRAVWESLADALWRHARDNDVAVTEETPFGTSYAVDGPLTAPDGRTPRIRSVWFIETGEAIPRLVTAYPLKEGRM